MKKIILFFGMLNFLHPVLKRYKLVSRKRNVRFRLPKSMELENDNNIPIPVRDRILKKNATTRNWYCLRNESIEEFSLMRYYCRPCGWSNCEFPDRIWYCQSNQSSLVNIQHLQYLHVSGFLHIHLIYCCTELRLAF